MKPQLTRIWRSCRCFLLHRSPVAEEEASSPTAPDRDRSRFSPARGAER